MKEIEIQPRGSYFEIDQDGYVINPASLDKIQEEYEPVIRDVIEAYKNHFGEKLKSVYLRGSVSKGQAVKNISDVDTFSYINLPKEEIDNDWKIETIYKLKEQYPFIENAELICHSTSKPLNYILLNQSVCVYGESVQVRKLKPGKEMMLHIPHLTERISVAEKKLQYSESEESIRDTCVWIMKDILRLGFELTMEHSKRYTRDLYLCYKDFSEYYPEKKEQMREVLQYSLNPTSDKNKIKEIRDTFMPWLAQEVSKYT